MQAGMRPAVGKLPGPWMIASGVENQDRNCMLPHSRPSAIRPRLKAGLTCHVQTNRLLGNKWDVLSRLWLPPSTLLVQGRGVSCPQIAAW